MQGGRVEGALDKVVGAGGGWGSSQEGSSYLGKRGVDFVLNTLRSCGKPVTGTWHALVYFFKIYKV